MTQISTIREDIADAQAQLDNLTARAEIAADHGSRGPSPKEIADAEWLVEHHRRRLDLARGALPAPLAPVMGRIR